MLGANLAQEENEDLKIHVFNSRSASIGETLIVKKIVECEEAGMSCVVIAALPPIARQQGAPRITAPHVPIGSNAGEPNNIPQQTAIVKESLEWVRDCPSYNGMKVLPYEYRHNV